MFITRIYNNIVRKYFFSIAINILLYNNYEKKLFIHKYQ